LIMIPWPSSAWPVRLTNCVVPSSSW
jgi:hypothetical protein